MRWGILALPTCLALAGGLGSGSLDKGGLRSSSLESGSLGKPLADGSSCTVPSDALLFYSANGQDLGPVSTWPDQGSRKADATQSVTGDKPIAWPDCGSGKPCLNLDGNDNLDVASFTAISQPFTMCAVVGYREAVPGNRVLITESSGPGQYYIRANATSHGVHQGTTTVSVGEAPVQGDGFVVCNYADGASSKIRVNGSENTGSPGSGGPDSLKIGAYYNESLDWENQIFALGFWAGDVTEAFEEWAECEYGAAPFDLDATPDPEYQFDGRDIDGDGTNNSAYSTGDFVATWVNEGDTSGNCTQATQRQQPTLGKVAATDWVSFDGNADRCDIQNSDDGLAFVHATGHFDMFICARTDRRFSADEYLFASATSNGQSGMALEHQTDGTLRFRVFNGTATAIDFTTTGTLPVAETSCFEIRGNGSTVGISFDLSTFETSGFGTPGTAQSATADLTVGALSTGSNASDVAIQYLRIYNRQLNASDQAAVKTELEAFAETTPATTIAIIGDSIVQGNQAGLDTPWPTKLETTYGVAVGNYGISGDTAAQCLTNWTNNLRGDGHDTIILACGVNSVRSGVSAAATFTDLNTIATEVGTDGQTLAFGEVLPWRNGGLWDSSKQTETDSLNVSISADPDDVQTYDEMEDGTTTDALNDDWDIDGLHPNDDGGDQLVTLYGAALGL